MNILFGNPIGQFEIISLSDTHLSNPFRLIKIGYDLTLFQNEKTITIFQRLNQFYWRIIIINVLFFQMKLKSNKVLLILCSGWINIIDWQFMYNMIFQVF